MDRHCQAHPNPGCPHQATSLTCLKTKQSQQQPRLRAERAAQHMRMPTLRQVEQCAVCWVWRSSSARRSRRPMWSLKSSTRPALAYWGPPCPFVLSQRLKRLTPLHSTSNRGAQLCSGRHLWV